MDDVKAHQFFRQENWSWSNIKECVAPVVPELHGDEDTSNFDDIDDDSQQQPASFAAPVVSQFATLYA